MVAQEELCLGLQGGRRKETGTPLTGTQGTTYYVLASEQVTGRSKSFVFVLDNWKPLSKKEDSKKVKSRLSRTNRKGFSSLNMRDCRSNFNIPGLTFITMPLPK